jgi:hypothetical protein
VRWSMRHCAVGADVIQHQLTYTENRSAATGHTSKAATIRCAYCLSFFTASFSVSCLPLPANHFGPYSRPVCGQRMPGLPGCSGAVQACSHPRRTFHGNVRSCPAYAHVAMISNASKSHGSAGIKSM